MLCILSLAGLIAMTAPVRAQDTASDPAQNQDAAATAPAATSDAPQAGAGAIVPAGSDIEAVVFYIVGGVAAGCALGCVLSANIVRMAVCLFGTLGSVAIL